MLLKYSSTGAKYVSCHFSSQAKAVEMAMAIHQYPRRQSKRVPMPSLFVVCCILFNAHIDCFPVPHRSLAWPDCFSFFVIG